ncbi:MAG: hypothetical protein NT129_02150 [Candidatus Aenigmarchaeota archaeon]|nr:hypothetical protein [Candidatus Aenigmarchaeota archaeon]
MRGVFYSAIVMMLIAPIVMYIILYMDVAETNLNEISTKIKGDKMADYARSIDQDLPRMLEISSKRSIGSAISYIDMNGEPLDNADERLREMIMNSTIYGSGFGLLGTGSIKNWAEAIETNGRSYGFNTTITVLDINVTPYDSFNILLSATIYVNISDNKGMEVNRKYNQKIIISVEGFEDPLYGLETNGLIKRKFVRSLINDLSSLDTAVGNWLYINSTNGASFLDRLEGRLTTSDKYRAMTTKQIGLETIVYLPDLSSLGLTIKSGQSDVDYLYFDSVGHVGYPVNNSGYSWLKLDDEHADIYGVELIK